MSGAQSAGRRGLLMVLSSPSGAGKSTLARMLLDADDNLTLSISVTTRARRLSEVDGVHYHFIAADRFARMQAEGDLLEWAEVHGNLYATPRSPVERALAAGRDVLFDIDWQGTRQIAEAMPSDIVRVFILPPSIAELSARLKRRAEDSDEAIGRRLANARAEIEHWSEYEYVVVNDDVQHSLGIVRAILTAERQRRERQPGLAERVAGLLRET
ncbi:MAG: guanylate kinase [Bauldia sp.]